MAYLDLEVAPTEPEPMSPQPSRLPTRWLQVKHHWLPTIHKQSAYHLVPPEMDVPGSGDSQSSIRVPYPPRQPPRQPGAPRPASLNRKRRHAHRTLLAL